MDRAAPGRFAARRHCPCRGSRSRCAKLVYRLDERRFGIRMGRLVLCRVEIRAVRSSDLGVSGCAGLALPGDAVPNRAARISAREGALQVLTPGSTGPRAGHAGGRPHRLAPR